MICKVKNCVYWNSSKILLSFLSLIVLLMFFTPKSVSADEWTNYTNANEISGSAIDGNYLWIATRGGVVKWNLTDSSYTKFTTKDGLADLNVKDVFVDNEGNKWFGTVEGVQKFNGSEWTTYNTSNSPLPDNRVYAIIQDTLGRMWFGTGHGIACLDSINWYVYTDLGGGATNVAVRGIGLDSQNRIWTANNPENYGDPGGVSVFDGTTWTRYDPNTSGIGQYFLSIIVDGNDNVWAGSWTAGIYKYNGSSWENITSSNSNLMGDQIECFAVEEDTIIWIGNHSWSTGGVSRFDGTNWTNYDTGTSGIGAKNIYSISINSNDKYFGTEANGISKLNYSNNSWSYYRTSNEPHCNYITSIDSDHNDKVYFGTAYAGVATFDGIIWSSYNSGNSGLSDDFVNCVYIDNGDTLWIGTQYSGLFKFDQTSWTNFDTLNSDLLGNNIVSITKDSQGNLWLGTEGWSGPSGQNGAVTKFDGSNWTNYYLQNSGLIDDDGLNVTVDNGDTIWIGSDEGVSKFNQFDNIWTNYTTSNGLVENHVRRITIDAENNKWFATRGGVSKFDGINWTNYTVSNGIANNDVKDIAVKEGTVWIATANGVSGFKDGSWITYRQIDGLADNYVSAVCIDSSGYKWFGTEECGISKYDDTGTGIIDSDTSLGIKLFAFPNPFRNKTNIRYHFEGIPLKDGYPILKIYDLSGRLIRSLNSLSSTTGLTTWDGRDKNGNKVKTGIYLIKIQTAPGKFIGTGKMIFIK